MHHVLNAAAQRRICTQIQNRFMQIGDEHARALAPLNSGGKVPSLLYVPRAQRSAGNSELRPSNAIGCTHEKGIEYLLGEVPMLRSAPTADIGLSKCGRDKHPRVCDDVIFIHRSCRDDGVRASANPSQVSLTRPARHLLRGARSSPSEDNTRCRDVEKRSRMGCYVSQMGT